MPYCYIIETLKSHNAELLVSATIEHQSVTNSQSYKPTGYHNTLHVLIFFLQNYSAAKYISAWTHS
jgi:hypothetical protein